MKGVASLGAILLVVALLAGAASALSYSMTVHTGTPSYSGAATIQVSGQVTPAPGPNTAVLIRVYNPDNSLVTADQATVNGTTGLFSDSFVAGGASLWIDGTYLINATWGAYGPAIFSTATFSWSSQSATITATSTATSTSAEVTTISTTSSSLSSSTMSSTTISSVSTGTQSSSSSTVSTSSTPVTSSSTSTSTSGGGGGIPEFPYQTFAVAVLTLIVVASYMLVRRQTRNHGAVEPVKVPFQLTYYDRSAIAR
jgi:hypothetical protein